MEDRRKNTQHCGQNRLMNHVARAMHPTLFDKEFETTTLASASVRTLRPSEQWGKQRAGHEQDVWIAMQVQKARGRCEVIFTTQPHTVRATAS